MQKMAGSYLVKRLGDELFAKPAPREETAEEASEEADEYDGQVVHDEEGQRLGTAHRVPDVAVYVVFDGYGRPEDVLARCLAQPDSRLLFQEERGRVTALIYVPDPSALPRRPEGLRADEV